MSHLEQWIRDNKLQESEVGVSLEPIIQASQLLQARKTETDVDSIVEMCSKLTTSQVSELFLNSFAYEMGKASGSIHTDRDRGQYRDR